LNHELLCLGEHYGLEPMQLYAALKEQAKTRHRRDFPWDKSWRLRALNCLQSGERLFADTGFLGLLILTVIFSAAQIDTRLTRDASTNFVSLILSDSLTVCLANCQP
jgi:hypothetical protein